MSTLAREDSFYFEDIVTVRSIQSGAANARVSLILLDRLQAFQLLFFAEWFQSGETEWGRIEMNKDQYDLDSATVEVCRLQAEFQRTIGGELKSTIGEILEVFELFFRPSQID